MAKRKSNKQVKAMICDVIRDSYQLKGDDCFVLFDCESGPIIVIGSNFIWPQNEIVVSIKA